MSNILFDPFHLECRGLQIVNEFRATDQGMADLMQPCDVWRMTLPLIKQLYLRNFIANKDLQPWSDFAFKFATFPQ